MLQSTTTRLSQPTIRRCASLREVALVVPSEVVSLVSSSAWDAVVVSFGSFSSKAKKVAVELMPEQTLQQ